MDKKNAIRSETVLNQNTVKVYTDGSKLDGRVGAGFFAEYPNNSPKQAFSTLKYIALCSRLGKIVIVIDKIVINYTILL